MDRPTLCKKHLYRVANYFDKRLAFEFEIGDANCLVCNKNMNVEMARWFVQQHKKETAAGTTLHARPSRLQA
jgi:hypothetical protein